MSQKEIKKITLTASVGVLKDFIHTFIDNKDISLFKLRVLASYVKTTVIIEGKFENKINPEEWGKLIEYIQAEISGLKVVVKTE